MKFGNAHVRARRNLIREANAGNRMIAIRSASELSRLRPLDPSKRHREFIMHQSWAWQHPPICDSLDGLAYRALTSKRGSSHSETSVHANPSPFKANESDSDVFPMMMRITKP